MNLKSFMGSQILGPKFKKQKNCCSVIQAIKLKNFETKKGNKRRSILRGMIMQLRNLQRLYSILFKIILNLAKIILV